MLSFSDVTPIAKRLASSSSGYDTHRSLANTRSRLDGYDVTMRYCNECETIFSGSLKAGEPKPVCPHCGSDSNQTSTNSGVIRMINTIRMATADYAMAA